MKNKQVIRDLLLLFLAISFVKIVASFFMRGPFIFSDEACVVQQSIYFSKNLKFLFCDEILNLNVGNQLPLYPVLLSPIYYFFQGLYAYIGVLILNSLLISSLVFPLYSIFKNFIRNHKIACIYSTIILFLASVLVFEKMLMTEVLFIVINIWFLYFYLKSFSKNIVRNKIIAFIFALLGVITRPFGFILLFAMLINEFIHSRHKKLIILISIPLFFLIYNFIFYFYSGLLDHLINQYLTLTEPKNILLFLKAFINQLNSLIIATFFIPLLLFITYINKNDSKQLKNIRYFLIAFICLNFFISAQHIYGYFLENNPLHLLTRYVNVSIIYLYIFGFIFFERYKIFKLTKFNVGFLFLTLFSLFLLDPEGKFAQNIDLGIYYNVYDMSKGAMSFAWDVYFYLLPIILILFFLLITNQRKFLRTFFVCVLMIYSIFTYFWLVQFPDVSRIQNFFIDKKDKTVLYVVESGRIDGDELVLTMKDFWKIYAFTDNKVKHIIRNKITDSFYNTSFTVDYFVSQYDLDFPVAAVVEEGYKIYENKK